MVVLFVFLVSKENFLKKSPVTITKFAGSKLTFTFLLFRLSKNTFKVEAFSGPLSIAKMHPYFLHIPLTPGRLPEVF
jgi:hypothetical protein